MAGFTNLPYREMAKEFGCSAYTVMKHANETSLINKNDYF